MVKRRYLKYWRHHEKRQSKMMNRVFIRLTAEFLMTSEREAWGLPPIEADAPEHAAEKMANVRFLTHLYNLGKWVI